MRFTAFQITSMKDELEKLGVEVLTSDPISILYLYNLFICNTSYADKEEIAFAVYKSRKHRGQEWQPVWKRNQ